MTHALASRRAHPRRTMRRVAAAATLAATGAMILGTASAHAETLPAGTDSTATGTVAEVDLTPPADSPLAPTPVGEALDTVSPIVISESEATAGNPSQSSGTVVGVGDNTLGSTQTGPGSTSDAVLDTEDTPLGRAQVAPSSSTVSEDSTRSESSASVAEANSPDGEIAAKVAHSNAQATRTPTAWSAGSESVLLDLTLGDTRIRVLRAVATDTGGQLHLIQIGDDSPVPVTELGEVCAQSTDGIAQAVGGIELICATARAGFASLLDAVLAPTAADGTLASPIAVLGNAINATAGATPTQTPGAQPGVGGDDTTPGPQFGTAPSTGVVPGNALSAANTARSTGTLPFTGAGLGVLAALGATLGAAGLALRHAARKPARTTLGSL